MALNLRHLLSVSTQLSLEACHVIQQSLRERSFQRYMKGENDPVTDVDFKIQSMLIRGFKMHFPHLYIIGEESEEFKGNIEYDYRRLTPDLLPDHAIQSGPEIELKEACLWIDPIDCTLGFLNGREEDVTVLIGLSHKKRAVAGVIATPFKEQANNKLYSPIITVGSVGHKQTLDFDGTTWTQKVKPKQQKPLRVVSSNTRQSRAEQHLVRDLRGVNIRAGGAGRKAMMVANGEADVMVYLESNTHKWDSCAGEAIVKSLGGFYSRPGGSPIYYFNDSQHTLNSQGLVAAMNRLVYEECIDCINGN